MKVVVVVVMEIRLPSWRNAFAFMLKKMRYLKLVGNALVLMPYFIAIRESSTSSQFRDLCVDQNDFGCVIQLPMFEVYGQNHSNGD